MNTFSGKTSTISNQVADYLRDEIISGNIKSGERIKESGLTQKFNVSSIPVREALKKIESEGYIDIVPYAGALVRKVDLKALDEYLELSLALMDILLRSSLPQMSENDLNEADEMIRKMESCTDSKAFGLMAIDYFAILYRAAKKEIVMEMAICIFRKNLMLVNLLPTDIYIARKEEDPHWTFIKMVREKDFESAIFYRKEMLAKQTENLKMALETK